MCVYVCIQHWKQEVSPSAMDLGTYHNSAVLWTAGNNLVVMWTPVYVQHWPSVATYRRIGFVNSPRLKEEINHYVTRWYGHHQHMLTITAQSLLSVYDHVQLAQCQPVGTNHFHSRTVTTNGTLSHYKDSKFWNQSILSALKIAKTAGAHL